MFPQHRVASGYSVQGGYSVPGMQAGYPARYAHPQSSFPMRPVQAGVQVASPYRTMNGTHVVAHQPTYRTVYSNARPVMSKPTIGYWKIRGLAAPMRMAAVYAGAEFENVEYGFEPKEGGGWDVSSWFDTKPEFKERNALANLPYVEDGDQLICQSNSGLLYLGRKWGLAGKNEMELCRVEQALCEIFDLSNKAVAFLYNPGNKDGFNEKVQTHLKDVASSYEKLNGFLEQGKTAFLAAETPTVADFCMFEKIDVHERLAKCTDSESPVAAFKHLGNLYADVRALPELQSYFDGPMYALPCNGAMAVWGGDTNDGR